MKWYEETTSGVCCAKRILSIRPETKSPKTIMSGNDAANERNGRPLLLRGATNEGFECNDNAKGPTTECASTKGFQVGENG